MATSRTGTSVYLRNRRKVLAQAKRAGITHCPGYTDLNGKHHPCGVELDYTTGRLPNSVEVDHIKPVRHGGTDDVENLAPCCMTCNRRKGDGGRASVPVPAQTDFPLSREW